jgi:hypothetical protein
MRCVPALQSWCLVPTSDGVGKFTHVHEHLQKNPAVLAEVLRRARIPPPRPVYPVRIEAADVTPTSLLDTLQQWDLIDVVDLKIGPEFLEIVFRTPVSANVATRLPEFRATSLVWLPRTARVPLVYIQGIRADTTEDEIRNFFKTIAPILKIKFVSRETISAHILKLSSVRKALRVSETADRERFKGSVLTVSHQFKSTITNCFFLSGPSPGSLTVASVESEVAQIGAIERIFINEIGPMKEVFVSMADIAGARLACGIMNHRIYNGEVVNAFFVDPQYFEAVFDANQAKTR